MAQVYDIPIAVGTQIVDWLPALNSALDSVRTFFAGTTDPAGVGGVGTLPRMPWIDDSDGTFYIRDLGDTAWITVGDADLPNLGLLSAGGGTMTGALDLDGKDMILDADGDSKLDLSTDDVISVELGGAVEYVLDATTLDCKGNQIKDAKNDGTTTTGAVVGRLLVDISGTERAIEIKALS